MGEFSNASYKLVRMKSLIYAVRHGETELNAGNKFRGFMDVPLDRNGIKQAKEIRDILSGAKLSHAYSSDLKRASETVDIILQGRDIPSKILADIRPWNVGQFSGKPKNAENKKALQEYADNPDKVIPGGESLNQFRARYKKAFDAILAEAEASISSGYGLSLIVQHASNSHELGNILYNDIDALDVDPGGVIVISRTGNKLSSHVLKGAAENTTDYGSS